MEEESVQKARDAWEAAMAKTDALLASITSSGDYSGQTVPSGSQYEC